MPCKRMLLAWALAAWLPMAAHAQTATAEPAPAAADATPAETCPAIPLAGADAAAVRVPSAPDACGGPRTGDEDTLSDRVVRYEIAATVDPDHPNRSGSQELTWRNRSAQPGVHVY